MIEIIRTVVKAEVTSHSRLVLCLFLLVSQQAWGKIESPDLKLFPRPPTVERQIKFWEKIFRIYPSYATVIHDLRNPDHIIDIIDFKVWAGEKGLNQIPSRKMKNMIINSYLKRYRLALKRFRRMGKLALKFGPIENRIFNVYKKNKTDVRSLYKGKIYLRSQNGLADEFIEAAKRAQEYLPFMEKAFEKEGVPQHVTRLAFVESMFNLKARSKVGASGIWQFMPSTAKRYLIINRFVDERNSPFKASKAAAKLLLKNYKRLKSWPLAITAYNHGLAGMRRAVRQTRSRSIDDIISKFRSQSFGFASKNFYSEFLAATNVYDLILKKNLLKKVNKKIDVVAIKLNKRLSVAQMLKKAPILRDSFEKFNNGIRKSAFSRYKFRKLPRKFEIFVPKTIAEKVKKGLQIRDYKKYAKSK